MAIPPDVHRLIYDALARLGEGADPEAVVRAVRRLDYGLPAEDEFSVICAWLGQCELIHKLDQQQTPPASRENFQVPDLLAKFAPAGPVLIEVKVCNDHKLSFKPDYHRRLMAYSELLGLPLLIAWKHHTIWTLFEYRHVELARVNYNIRLDLAFRQNLLGLLAGDVAFKPQEGAGMVFELSKEELLETEATGEATVEHWRMRISDISFRKGGNQPTRLDAEVAQLFTAMDLESSDEHGPDAVHRRFFVGKEAGLQFAHRALVALLEWESGTSSRASWRSLLGSNQIVRSIGDFQSALSRGIDAGVIRYVFHVRPADTPEFMLPGPPT